MEELHWVSRYALGLYKSLLLSGMSNEEIATESNLSYSSLISMKNRDFANISLVTLQKLDELVDSLVEDNV